MSNPALSLLYVHTTSMGYGRLGVYLADAVRAAGVDVFDHLPGPNEQLTLGNFSGHQPGIAEVVCWVSTPSHARGWYEKQSPMIFTMWEATKLPESFRENMHNFERIIVPSEQNAELFSKYHKDVWYVPLGVDLDRWHFTPRQTPTTSFRFLIGGSGARKGTDVARKAFRIAFPHWDAEGWKGEGIPPTLVMKSPRGEEPVGPGIEMVAGKLTDADEVALYANAHCYLQPSRGEGFGLQPLQAMAQGMPTILTDAHGHRSFAHLGLPIGFTMAPANYFIYGDAGDWWEPNLDDLVDQMRWVYDNYAAACVMAEQSAAVVAEEFNWGLVGDRFLDAIGRSSLNVLDDPGEWKEAELARFKVRVAQPWTADIGGSTYQFTPGVDYWEPADVKRILFEADLLDPACLEMGGAEDMGLTQTQAGLVESYSARHSYCTECHQKLGSGVTRADEIFDQLQREAGVT